MKKLMVIAALTAVASVEAACIDPTTPQPGPTVWPAQVYQWQFKGKTGVGVIVKGSTQTQRTGGGCIDPGTITVVVDDEVVRVPGTLALTGYTYICDAECQNFGSDLLTPTKAQYFATKPWKSLVTQYRGRNFISQIDVDHLIGKNKSQYELAGEATFNFGDTPATVADLKESFIVRFAGFGSYDRKNGRVSSVSGNFAGTQQVPRYNGSVTFAGVASRCPEAGYWDCQTLGYVIGSNADAVLNRSVAYGTWSVKYNASASKRIAENKTNYWVK